MPEINLPYLNLPDKKSLPQSTFERVFKENPDQVAEISYLAKKTGQPVPLVAANIPEAKAAATYPQAFWDDLDAKYPGTSKWVQKPENMAIAHDDIENLTGIEKAHTFFKNNLKSMGGAVAGMVESTGGFVNASGSLDRAVFGDSVGNFEKNIGGSVADYGRKMAEYYNVTDPTFTNKIVSAATSSAVFFVPGMGIARGVQGLAAIPRLAAFAGAGFSAAFESAIEAGAVHETMKQKGASDADALAAASKTFGANMALNTGLNMAGGLFTKALPKGTATIAKGNALVRAGKDAAKAGAAEFVQEGSQQIISNNATGEPLMSGTLESAILGGLVGGGMSGVMDAGNRLGNRKRAEASRQYVTAMSDAIVKSKTITRSPEALEGIMKEIQAPPVLIPIEAFEKHWEAQGIVPEQAAKELDAVESYTTAKETGGDVLVPMALFQSKLMDEHRGELINDIRLDPTHLTKNEEILADKELGLLMQSQVEQAEKDADKQATPEMVAKRAEDRKVLESLHRANDEAAIIERFGQEEGSKIINTVAPLQARMDAILLERARVAKPGITAEEFYAKRKSGLQADSFAPENLTGDTLPELTQEERSAIEKQTYLEDMAEAGGVTPAIDALRGKLSLAKFKKFGYHNELQDMQNLGIFSSNPQGYGPSEAAERLFSEGLIPEYSEQAAVDMLQAESRKIGEFKYQHGTDGYKKLRGKLHQAAVEKGQAKLLAGTKVVDGEGKPVMVYHGTAGAFSEFKKPKRVKTGNSYESDSGAGIFFAANPKAADFHSVVKGKEKNKQMFGAPLGSNVRPVYLNIKNPLVYDFEGAIKSPGIVSDLSKQAKKDGNDGLIIKNVVDAPGVDAGDIYVAFSPDQIVNAIGVKDPSALMQAALLPLNSFVLHQPAYHGSPYSFDRFTLDHIGKGEGAQAYGYGLYFAGDKSVAEYYRDSLTDVPNHYTVLGKEVQAWSEKVERGDDWETASFLEEVLLNKSLTDLKEQFSKKNQKEMGYSDRIIKMVQKLKPSDIRAFDEKGKEISKGNLYEVNIPEDDVLLDWDKPLSQSSGKVFSALQSMADADVATAQEPKSFTASVAIRADHTGQEFYELLAHRMRGADKASKALHDVGIKGIKYLDGNSRGKEKGSHNYVIFDDSAIEILNKLYQAAPKLPDHNLPVYKAIARLKEMSTEQTVYKIDKVTGEEIKKDPTILEAHFKEQDTSKLSEDYLASKLDEKEKATFEAQAHTWGFASGSDMAHAIIEALSPQTASNEKAAARWVEDNGGAQAYRGSYDALARLRTLGPAADASTVIHEFVHGYFSDVWSYIKAGEADAVTKADFDVFKKWAVDPKAVLDGIKEEAKNTADKHRAKELKKILAEIKAKGGVKFIQAHGEAKFLDATNKTEREIARHFHERLARGFEAYMREGKAPTPELTGVFSNFRSWLVKIYKAATDLNISLSKDVRDAFSRMVAADDEITHAEMDMGYNDGELPALLPKDEADALQKVRDTAHEAAVSEVTARLMDEISPEYKARVEEKRQMAIKAFTAQVEDLPVNRARKALEAMFPGQDWISLQNSYGAYDVTAEIENAFDAVAKQENYASAAALANDMGVSDTVEEDVAKRLEHYMAQFEPAHKTERIKEWALEAVNGEAQLEVLALESGIASDLGLSQATGKPYQERARRERTETARIARFKAKEKLGGMAVKSAISYLPYVTYSKKAAVKAAQALANKDYKAYSVAKRQEIVNHALMLEALRLREVVKKAKAYLETAGTKAETLPSGGKLTITPEANEQVNALLHRFGLTENLLPVLNRERVGLNEYITEAKVRGDDIEVADWIRDNTESKTDISEITVAQLLDLKDAVRSLKYSGHRAKVFSTGEDVDTFSHERAVAIAKELKANPEVYNPGEANIVLDKLGNYINSHRSLTWICHQLDGFKYGTLSKFVMGKLRKARLKETVMGSEAAKQMEAIIAEHFPAEGNIPWNKWEKRRELSSKKHFIDDPVIKQQFPGGITRETAIMILLNQGTELNRVRLLESYATRTRGIDGRPEWVMPMGQEHIDKIIGILGKSDVQFAQKVLDLVGSYWGQIAELQRARTGIMPVGREALEIKTPHGTIKGGYFHIAYDFRYNEIANRQGLEDLAKGEAQYIIPSTRRGHTKETVRHVYGRKLKLQFSLIESHLKDVIHDLAFVEAIRDVDLFFNHPEIIQAVSSTMGTKAYRQIRPILAAVGYENQTRGNEVEGFFGALRVKVTGFYLMYRLSSVVSQISGIGTAMRSVGGWNYLSHMRAATNFQFILDNSRIMKERLGNRDRDVRDSIRSEMNKGGPLTDIKKFGFIMQGYMDIAVALPQWQAAFDTELNRQAMAGEKINPDDAVTVADEVVQANQGSGDPIDQSQMQRGTPLMKLLTMFYTPFSPYANAQMEIWARLRQNGIKDLPEALSFLMYFGVLPAIAEGFLKNQMPDDDDDSEAWAAWAAKAMTSQVFGGWIGARDVANYVANPKMGYKLSAVESGVTTALTPVIDITKMVTSDKEPDAAKVAKGISNATMLWFAMPAKQVDLVIGYIMALINGDEEGSHPARLLTPPKK